MISIQTNYIVHYFNSVNRKDVKFYTHNHETMPNFVIVILSLDVQFQYKNNNVNYRIVTMHLWAAKTKRFAFKGNLRSGKDHKRDVTNTLYSEDTFADFWVIKKNLWLIKKGNKE